MVAYRRGDIVLAVFKGDYGKPRPAVIVQADIINSTHPSVVTCPITGTLTKPSAFRLTLDPSQQNGLRKPSQVMTDKIMTIAREHIRARIGRIDGELMERLDLRLMLVLGLAE